MCVHSVQETTWQANAIAGSPGMDTPTAGSASRPSVLSASAHQQVCLCVNFSDRALGQVFTCEDPCLSWQSSDAPMAECLSWCSLSCKKAPPQCALRGTLSRHVTSEDNQECMCWRSPFRRPARQEGPFAMDLPDSKSQNTVCRDVSCSRVSALLVLM